MPRFFFDFVDGGVTTQDVEGIEFATVEEAQREAQRTLAEIAKDELPDGEHREFVLVVREGLEPVLTAYLSLRVEHRRY